MDAIQYNGRLYALAWVDGPMAEVDEFGTCIRIVTDRTEYRAIIDAMLESLEEMFDDNRRR